MQILSSKQVRNCLRGVAGGGRVEPRSPWWGARPRTFDTRLFYEGSVRVVEAVHLVHAGSQ
jgi:hypothetical protein